MIRNVIVVLALFAYLSIADGADLVKETDYQILYATPGEFEEVKQNLELAITHQGLVVNNVADIGSMLDKTGVDLGEGEQPVGCGELANRIGREIIQLTKDAVPSSPHPTH